MGSGSLKAVGAVSTKLPFTIVNGRMFVHCSHLPSFNLPFTIVRVTLYHCTRLVLFGAVLFLSSRNNVLPLFYGYWSHFEMGWYLLHQQKRF